MVRFYATTVGRRSMRLRKLQNMSFTLFSSWSSLDKGESLTGLPDYFSIQQKDRLFLKGNLFNLTLKNNPAYC